MLMLLIRCFSCYAAADICRYDAAHTRLIYAATFRQRAIRHTPRLFAAATPLRCHAATLMRCF